MFSLFLTVFFAMAGFSVLLPSFLFAVKNLGASSGMATLALAGYSIAAFLSGQFWGRLSDRMGRKPVLLMTMIGAAVTYVGLALFADNLIVVFAALFVAGLAAGNMSVLFAAVADRTSEEKRAKGMGLIGAGIGLAFTVGPLIGGYIGGHDADTAHLAAPATASAISAVLGLLAILLIFKDAAQETRHTAAKIGRIEAFAKIRSRPAILSFVLVIFAFTTALAFMEASLPLLLDLRFDWGPRHVGRVFVIVGLVMIIVQGGLIGPLSRRLGEWRVAVLGMFNMMAGLGVIMMAGAVEVLIVGVAIAAAGTALHQSALAALTSRQAGAEERGLVMGVFQSFQSLGRAAGPMVAGVAFDVWDGLPLLLGLVLVLAAYMRLRQFPQSAGVELAE